LVVHSPRRTDHLDTPLPLLSNALRLDVGADRGALRHHASIHQRVEQLELDVAARPAS
jgi:hypothetical protein